MLKTIFVVASIVGAVSLGVSLYTAVESSEHRKAVVNGMDACLTQSIARNDLISSERCLRGFYDASHREVTDWMDVFAKLAVRGAR